MTEHSLPFEIGRLAEKAGKIAQARRLYEKVASRDGGDKAHAFYRLGNLDFRAGDLVSARKNITSATNLDDHHASWYYRLGSIFESEGQLESACKAYVRAVELQPDNADWLERLSRCRNALRVSNAKAQDHEARRLRKAGLRWQEIEVMRANSGSFSQNAEWHVRLGDALEVMRKYAEAAEAFGRANELKPRNANWLFKEARCWDMAGQKYRADQLFADAMAADPSGAAQNLGVGVFYQHYGDWEGAADAYEASCRENPGNAQLHFRAGLALERCYRWIEAAVHYETATALEPTESPWHFRRGFVQERLGNWNEAAECYRHGLDYSSPSTSRYWYYRLGYVLQESGDAESSVAAYLESYADKADLRTEPGINGASGGYAMTLLEKRRHVAMNGGGEELNRLVAQELEQLERWEDAALHYALAAERSDKHSALAFYRLGRALYRAGDLNKALNAFRMTKIVAKPRGIDPKKYAKDIVLTRIFDYSEMTENLPLRENVILYESFMGAKIACNPYAMYLQLKTRPDFANHLHIWVITDRTYIPAHMRGLRNTTFVIRGSHRYRRYLATAKYLINNVTFESYFVRREGQQYLNTWHGTPLKSLGRDIRSGFLEHKNVTRNFLQATHMLSGNDHTTKVLTERYDVATLRMGSIAETGYPRVDRTLKMSADERRSIRKRLGLPDDGKKIVLYAPTWRGDLSGSHFDVDKLTSDLQMLASVDCHLLFQAHHHTESLVPHNLDVIIVPKTIETNDLLAVTDVLVTDYSSILFDFAATGRPAICYVYDLAAYVEERGLYFTPAQLGLTQVEDIHALVSALEGALSTDSNARVSEVRHRFCPQEDGEATSRAIDYFFYGSTKNVVAPSSPSKHSILFHHSFLANGITASLVNLICSLDPNLYDITVVVPVADIEKDPARQAKLWELPSTVHIVGQFGRQVLNIEEKWIIDYFNRRNAFTSEAQHRIYSAAFGREYRRVFSDTQFDTVVEFEGYSRFWSSMLAQASGEYVRKLVFLHNDMFEEWRSKYHYLAGMFALYPRFDAYVSVSPALAGQNRDKLSRSIGLDPSKFVSAINQIDAAKVHTKAAEGLDEDLEPWFTPDIPTILSIGRLSPEKDHKKLLAAVSRLLDSGRKVRLVIFGAGPLESSLQKEIEERRLGRSVYLAGQRPNPFPALARCSVFALASNHEGQPMVLLEALILGTKTVATDIVGSRFVLEGTSGKLVDNSVDGLVEGLTEVIYGRTEVIADPFDSELYSKKATEAFLSVALK